MFKFLRKYSVWILGFGGSLLLIAFLAPNVIQQLAQRAGYAGTKQATVGEGESVGYDQWQKNVTESQIIDRLGVSLPGIGSIESPSHWFLLTREADLAGLTPALNAVTIDAATVTNIARNTGVRPQTVLETLSHLEGVQRLLRIYQSAGRFSDRRIHNAADNYLSTVAVETVVIPANTGDAEVSEETLLAQFEAWKDVPAGEGDQGFGYKLPDRFKVEWIHIPAESIRQAAKLSDDFTTREQRKYWRRNENDPRFPIVEGSTEIPETVSEAYLDFLTEHSRDEIARTMSEQLRLPRRGFEEQDGFIVLPENWSDQKLGLEELASNVQKTFSIDLPAYGSVGDWISTADAASTPVLGEVAATNLGDATVPFATLIGSSKEFGGTGIYRVQQDVTAPIVETDNGELFVFRITDSDPSRTPTNLDEVRAKVHADASRLQEWTTLQAKLDAVQDDARNNGMLQVAMDNNASVSRPQSVSLVDAGVPAILDAATKQSLLSQTILTRLGSGASIEEMVSSIQALEQTDPAVVKSIIARTENIPLDTPIADLPVEERIFVVPSNENMALVVVRVTGTTPTSKELANGLSGNASPILQTLMAFDELGGTKGIGDAFSLETLTERHNFKRGRENVASVDEE
ncbi:MAG TPA: hypothetical protein QF528_00325 [Phycisphaerales bacterium]|nr:hypothetical protein [Phycisphaerales bacterium]|tara:strand:- start:3772 stop:5667 length:1896 start_codon:yes stop_codon:yes gene_type:complete